MMIAPIVAYALIAAASAVQGAAEFNNWKLTLQVDAPRAVVVHSRGGVSKTVFCVTFSVHNQSAGARNIMPFVKLATDTKQTVGASYDPAAIEALAWFTREEYVDVYALGGGFEDGASKRCVAVFEAVDPFANHFELQFQGFASPLVRYGKEYNQMQTEYRATFHRAGNEYQIVSGRVEFVSDAWVTVEKKKVR